MPFKMCSATGSGPLLHPCASLCELRLQKIIVFPDLTYCCCTSPGLSAFAISSLPSVVKLSLVVRKDTNPQTCTFSSGVAPCAGHCMKISLMNMRISLVIDEHENVNDIISYNLICHGIAWNCILLSYMRGDTRWVLFNLARACFIAIMRLQTDMCPCPTNLVKHHAHVIPRSILHRRGSSSLFIKERPWGYMCAGHDQPSLVSTLDNTWSIAHILYQFALYESNRFSTKGQLNSSLTGSDLTTCSKRCQNVNSWTCAHPLKHCMHHFVEDSWRKNLGHCLSKTYHGVHTLPCLVELISEVT